MLDFNPVRLITENLQNLVGRFTSFFLLLVFVDEQRTTLFLAYKWSTAFMYTVGMFYFLRLSKIKSFFRRTLKVLHPFDLRIQKKKKLKSASLV